MVVPGDGIKTGDGIATTGDEITHEPITEPRPIRAARKRQVLGKGRCQYNNCNKPAEHIHHPDRYAKTKNHNNLTALCRDHHEFAHNGLIENEQATAKNWAINIHKSPCEIDRLYRNYRQK